MRRRGLAANSAFALTADLGGKASTVVVTVIAARTLSTREFALLATCLAAAGLLTNLLDAGAQTLLARDGAEGTRARGALFRSLAVGRIPLVALALVATVLVGVILGRPLESLATITLAAVLAAGLSLTGLLRSAQDMRPEAVSKLLTGVLSTCLVVIVALMAPSAGAVLIVLAVTSAVGLLPLVRAARRAASFDPGRGPGPAVRAAVPLCLLSLATVAYYRSGVIALSLLGSSKETAHYAVAANVAFGLLTVPNAVTTGLLPKLSGDPSPQRRLQTARRALGWTVVISGGLVAATALVGPTLLVLVFGDDYAAAARPLVILTAGVFAIAISGILGTVLVAGRSLRPLAAQVALSLAVNLLCLALLVPRLGASGAALATVACEFVGLCVLAFVARRSLPGLIRVGAPIMARRPTFDT